MVDQICFRKDYFITFVVVAVALILWVLYKVYDKVLAISQISQLLQNDAPIPVSPPTPVSSPSQPPMTPQPVLPPYVPEVSIPSPISLPPVSLMPGRPPLITYRSHYGYGDPSYGEYQLVGYVHPEHHSERHPDQMFRLMGRQFTPSRFEYYVIHPLTDIKIPIHHKNDWELNTGDRVTVPGFKGHYIVFIYDMDRVIF
uniref:Uncharacterized protein n=1 Tax=viral metagenome TaxID=1070528 RepID=A0A6C0BLL0_9ZZZZ